MPFIDLRIEGVIMAGGGGSSGFPSGLWVVDIEKVYEGEYWTNRYIVEGANLASAHASANDIVTRERAVHLDIILFTKVRTSDGQPDTDIYQVQNLNVFGLHATGSNVLLPLFNVARVDFSTEGGGRPSRKYLRGVLTEGDIQYTAISVPMLDLLNDSYATPMAALAAYVDVDGQAFFTGSAYPYVGMRQLRRGSKRKAPV